MVRLSLLEKVVECKKAYDEHNLPKAFEVWCSIYDEVEELEKIENATSVMLEYHNTMRLFSDEEVYNITDYGKKINGA